MKQLIAIFALCLISTASTEAQRRQLHYEPEKVTLTGRIVSRTFYGPPNYGENPKTDSREAQYILLLVTPIDVITTDKETIGETERGISRVTHFFFLRRAATASRARGRR